MSGERQIMRPQLPSVKVRRDHMMFKRLITLAYLSISALVGCGAPVWAAGTTPFALAIQYDTSGNLASGCLLNFYVAGTVATPQTAYADFGLTTPLPNPLVCDQSGRVPLHWLADGLIHVRLTDSAGGVIVDNTLQVLGPSSGGGGGGGTVDPTAIMQTGTIMSFYGTGARSGFVRSNGLTIGNATSGATERANADTQALFIYLYNADGSLVVTGGRSGNALNDFNASKQIALPDLRGRALAGVDDMGGGDANRLTSGALAPGRFTLGYAGGESGHTLTQAELPTSIGTTPPTAIAGGTFTYDVTPHSNGSAGGFSAIGPGQIAQSGLPSTVQVTNSLLGSMNVTNSAGGGNHNIMQPTMLITFYIRL
ncbi:hypothetical protein ACRAVF_27305 [Bradyrhizobium oligotrophicum S58]